MSNLIVGATDLELSVLIEKLNFKQEKPFFDFSIYHSTHNKRDIILVRSGPGIANAAAAAAVAIDRYRIDHVFNVGVCGAYSQDARLLARVVVGVHAVFADTGMETDTAFLPLSAMDLPLANIKGAKIFNIIKLNSDHVPRQITRGDFATVAVFSGSAHVAQKISRRFKVNPGELLCEDMESAAVALLALKASIPCTVLRGISNLCGERNHSEWKLSEAAGAAQKELLKLL